MNSGVTGTLEQLPFSTNYFLSGWHERFLHEIWTCVIPEKEAARRISERDGKSEDEAKKRLEAQKVRRINEEA